MNKPIPASEFTRTPEVLQHEKSLRAAFDIECDAAEVYQGDGPAMAYFQTAPHQAGGLSEARNYIYTSFGMGGAKQEGAIMPISSNVAAVLSESIRFFREWLVPKRTLVWRQRPMVDICSEDGRYGSYWRCVQLEDDARVLNIVWHF